MNTNMVVEFIFLSLFNCFQDVMGLGSSFVFHRRYFVLAMMVFGYVLNVGFRSVYAMVMTHVTGVEENSHGSDLFPNCTTLEGNASYHAPYTSDLISYSHALYFLGATLGQVPGGILSTRLSPKNVLGVGMILASIMQFLLPLVVQVHIVLLMAYRFVQGFVEMGVVPAVYTLITNWAPESEKNRFMTAAAGGVYLSPAFAMILSGLTSCYWSWYSSFIVIGVLGIVWSLVLLFCICDSPVEHPGLSMKEIFIFQNEGISVKASSKQVMDAVPWRKLMTSMPIYALIAAEFTKDWMFAIMGTEIQEYFKDVYGLNSATLGTLSAIPDIIMAGVAIAGGFIFDYLLIWRVLSTTAVRKIAQSMGFGIEAFFIIGLYFLRSEEWKQAFILLCVGVGISGLAVSGYEANYMDLDPQYTAIVSGISRIGLIGPVCSTILVGAVAGRSHTVEDWNIIFLVSGIMHLIGTLFYAVFASGKRQHWTTKDKHESVMFGRNTSKYGSIPEEREVPY